MGIYWLQNNYNKIDQIFTVSSEFGRYDNNLVSYFNV